MSKDPAFLFYAGDYLRDTQCLSEPAQVAYDRIMCEHMRKICITQQQLNFFTRRLADEEKLEVQMVLEKQTDGTYQIPWVAESILKRRDYSESRRQNRTQSPSGNTKKLKAKSKTYDPHMENENVIETEIVSVKKSPPKNAKFTIPTVEQITTILSEVDATNFLNHYESNGWMVGKNKMKNWKAAAKNWLNRKNQFNNGNTNKPNQTSIKPKPHDNSPNIFKQ